MRDWSRCVGLGRLLSKKQTSKQTIKQFVSRISKMGSQCCNLYKTLEESYRKHTGNPQYKIKADRVAALGVVSRQQSWVLTFWMLGQSSSTNQSTTALICVSLNSIPDLHLQRIVWSWKCLNKTVLTVRHRFSTLTILESKRSLGGSVETNSC